MIATADAARTAAAIRSMGLAVIAMADAMAHADQVQWLAPPAPVKELTDSRPPAGGIKRPTESTATDPRRMAVRAAVISSELTAEDITAKATAAAAELQAAVASWGGVRA